MTTLDHLNTLRQAAGKAPLKAWKESKAKLADAIAKLDRARSEFPNTVIEAPAVADPVQEFIKKNGVKQCPISPELKAVQARNAELDRIAEKRVKGDTAAKLSKPAKAKPVTTPVRTAKAKDPNVVTLADIARELGVNPKIARAKMRRITVPAEHVVAKYVYKASSKGAVIDLLQKDGRKA